MGGSDGKIYIFFGARSYESEWQKEYNKYSLWFALEMVVLDEPQNGDRWDFWVANWLLS